MYAYLMTKTGIVTHKIIRDEKENYFPIEVENNSNDSFGKSVFIKLTITST